MQAIIENTDSMICLRDTNCNLIYYNTLFSKFIKEQFDIEPCVGMNTLELLSDEQRKRWEVIWNDVLKGNKYKKEFSWELPINTIKHFEVSYNPVFIDNEIIGFSEFTRDVTESKITEVKLKERVKELNCISELSRLVEKAEDINSILNKLLYILKKSWQFPDITEVRIKNNNSIFQTDNFTDSKWSMHSEIIIEGQKKGEIQIVVLDDKYTRNEEPFLEEEYNLLNLVSERLSEIIERLQRSINYYELFQTLSEGILKTNEMGIIIDANPEAAKISGYNNPEELIGKPMTDLYSESEMRIDIINELKSKGGSFNNYGFRLKRKDNSLIPTLCNIRMLYNYDGEFAGTLGTFHDVSEKIKVEQALKNSEERFHRLFENMPNGVTIYKSINDGNDFEFIDINKQAEVITKSSKKELIGQTLLKKFPYLVNTPLIKNLQKTYKDKNTIYVPPFHYEENKQKRWQENYIYNLQSGEIVVISRDVTDQKQAEQALVNSENKYRKLVETIQEGIWQIDSQNNTTFVNKKMADIYDEPFCQHIFSHI